MTRPSEVSCPCERDVLDLVAIGQWPSRADATLRAHVAACGSCAEVASIAAVVRDWANETDAADAAQPARMPDASVVWYRAQVRAREDAARRASRPVLVAQLFAVATVALAVFWMGPSLSLSLSLPDVSGWWAAVPSWPTMPDVSTDSLSRFSWVGWAALAALGAWAIVGSIAYLLTAGE
jgi:hypothetical protein